MTYALPAALRADDDSVALGYLERYYGTRGTTRYTGSYFDGWGNNDPERFTADDLVAVSFLSVFVAPLAARSLLDAEADHFSQLLRAVGPDRDLADEARPITPNWPAWQLYAEVRKLDGIGSTIASKLLARKRPRLLPIYDSVVDQVTNAGAAQWEPLRYFLHTSDRALFQRLLRLHAKAGLGEQVTALRVYDVVTWMEGKARRLSPADPQEKMGAQLADPPDQVS